MLLGLSKPLGKSGLHEQEEYGNRALKAGTRSRCLTELQYSMMILHLAAKYVPSKQDKIMEHYSCTTIRILCIIDRAHSHVLNRRCILPTNQRLSCTAFLSHFGYTPPRMVKGQPYLDQLPRKYMPLTNYGNQYIRPKLCLKTNTGLQRLYKDIMQD